jgi:hypothetical protein
MSIYGSRYGPVTMFVDIDTDAVLIVIGGRAAE